MILYLFKCTNINLIRLFIVSYRFYNLLLMNLYIDIVRVSQEKFCNQLNSEGRLKPIYLLIVLFQVLFFIAFIRNSYN